MKLSELLATYSSVYPESGKWEETVELLLNDPVERATVEDLLEELSVHGTWREPILLDPGDEEYPPTVANGTHRVVASILHGLETVPVSHTTAPATPAEDSPETTSYSWLESEIRFAEPLSEELVDQLFGVLRSFRVDGNHWLTSAMLSADTAHARSSWATTALAPEAITAAVARRLEAHGIQTVSISTQLVHDEE